MGQIIAWKDATARYPELDKLPNVNAEQVQDRLVLYAEAAVHARLSSKYSVPFSSNNITARDLATDDATCLQPRASFRLASDARRKGHPPCRRKSIRGGRGYV